MVSFVNGWAHTKTSIPFIIKCTSIVWTRTGTAFWEKDFLPPSAIFWHTLIRTLAMHNRNGRTGGSLLKPEVDSTSLAINWQITWLRTEQESVFPAHQAIGQILKSLTQNHTVDEKSGLPFPLEMVIFLESKSLNDSGDCSSPQIISAKQSMHPCCAFETEMEGNIKSQTLTKIIKEIWLNSKICLYHHHHRAKANAKPLQEILWSRTSLDQMQDLCP